MSSRVGTRTEVAESPENGKPSLHMAEPPLFLLGCPRSGTTMLAELLAHTRWGSPFETHFITKYYPQIDHFGDLSEFPRFYELFRRLLNERAVQQWRLDIDPHEFHSSLSTFQFAEVADRLCRLHAHKHGKTSWGDKTPHYMLHLDMIRQLFPSSKVLHIVRDGRDVAMSLMRKSWGPANLFTCADYWNRCNSDEDSMIALAAAGLFHRIRYEDLLRNPSQELQKVLHFLGEGDLANDADKLVIPVRRLNSDKWKTQLSDRQIGIFESVAGDTLERYGYARTGRSERIGPVRRFGYRLDDRWKLTRHLFRANVIDTFRIRFCNAEPFAD